MTTLFIGHFLSLPVFLSFLFLASLFGAAVYLVYKTRSEKLKVKSEKSEQTAENLSPFTFHLLRLIAFGILWFFITLSVESSIIPIAMVIDEYRIYLPSVGFFIALVAGVMLLLKQMSQFIRLGESPTRGRAIARKVASLSLFALYHTGPCFSHLCAKCPLEGQDQPLGGCGQQEPEISTRV